MKKDLFSLSELETEIKARGVAVSLEYPGYLQIGEMAFGHSLGYETLYTWNSLEGDKGGDIPAFDSVEQVISELLKQLEGANA
jgi:hypothetical protein